MTASCGTEWGLQYIFPLISFKPIPTSSLGRKMSICSTAVRTKPKAGIHQRLRMISIRAELLRTRIKNVYGVLRTESGVQTGLAQSKHL
jgi:hypothetical protein